MIFGGGLGAAADDAQVERDRQASAEKWSQLIETPAQAKAALGFVAQELHTAYESLQASDAEWSIKEQVRQLLDMLNDVAKGTYSDVETYEAEGLDFSSIASQFGTIIGQLYADTDRQLKLVSNVTHFYDDGWTDAFWQAVAALPGMAQEAVQQVVQTARKAVNTAIGWPEWVIPTVVGVGVLGVGVWAYFSFLEPLRRAGKLRFA